MLIKRSKAERMGDSARRDPLLLLLALVFAAVAAAAAVLPMFFPSVL